MEVTNLSGKLRNKAGHGVCNSLRNQHKIPGVLYGREHQNMLVEFSEMDLNNVVRENGEHALVNLDINGSRVKAMIKEVQRDPIKRNLIHIDMKYVKDDEKVHADIPVVIKGEEVIRSKGGIIQKQLGNVSIEASPEKLPKFVVADVSRLKIGDKFTVSDMELSSDISVATDMNSIVAIISPLKDNEEVSHDIDEVQVLDSISSQK
jgi:large subunit ribosomal protein L25